MRRVVASITTALLVLGGGVVVAYAYSGIPAVDLVALRGAPHAAGSAA